MDRRRKVLFRYARLRALIVGGYGSGPVSLRRPTVEETRRLDSLEWYKKGLLFKPGRSWSMRWTNQNGDLTASIGCASTGGGVLVFYRSRGEDLSYKLPVELTPCNYGGSRPWFLCPATGCGRRSRFLHEAGRYYVCRTCAGLTYASRQASRNPSKLARLYGVPAFGGEFEPNPIRRLFYRLARASNPRKVERLRCRIERLEELRDADYTVLARLLVGSAT